MLIIITRHKPQKHINETPLTKNPRALKNNKRIKARIKHVEFHKQ